MKRIMVRYKVKADAVAENERLVAKVFEELHREKPAGLRYATFKLADGVSFAHVVSIETPDGANPLSSVGAFKTFGANIKERCVEPPLATELTEVGAYRFFGA